MKICIGSLDSLITNCGSVNEYSVVVFLSFNTGKATISRIGFHGLQEVFPPINCLYTKTCANHAWHETCSQLLKTCQRLILGSVSTCEIFGCFEIFYYNISTMAPFGRVEIRSLNFVHDFGDDDSRYIWSLVSKLPDVGSQ
jgi:hypothetical protein